MFEGNLPSPRVFKRYELRSKLIVNGNILLEQRTKVIFQYLLIGALLGGSGIIVAPEIAHCSFNIHNFTFLNVASDCY
jgi:hypothetical protein